MSKIAFVFPGQGAQYVGMAKDLYDKYDEAKNVIDKANEVLGIDIRKIMFEGPNEDLTKTENTQPAILTHCIAILEVLKSKMDVDFGYTAGLSLGEYCSLVAADSIEFEKAVKLVQKRGKYMQEAVPVGEGTMAAILGMERDLIKKALDDASQYGVAEFANFNSPGQIVISGAVKAIEKAVEGCKELGAKKAVVLKVSAPFHCSMLKPAGDNLAVELKDIEFNEPTKKLVANVNADYASKDQIKDLLIEQVSKSVMWEDSVERMINDGVREFVEIGPGKTLKSFINKKAKKMDVSVTIHNISDVDTLEAFLELKK